MLHIKVQRLYCYKIVSIQGLPSQKFRAKNVFLTLIVYFLSNYSLNSSCACFVEYVFFMFFLLTYSMEVAWMPLRHLSRQIIILRSMLIVLRRLWTGIWYFTSSRCLHSVVWLWFTFFYFQICSIFHQTFNVAWCYNERNQSGWFW